MRFAFLSAPVLAAVAVTVLSACSVVSPYRIDIRQGNYVDDAMVIQIKPGMTRDQVRFVLGSPLVVDVFRNDRWDYIYRFKAGNRSEVRQRTISIFFVNDVLDRIEGDVAPGEGKLQTESRSRVVEVPATK